MIKVFRKLVVKSTKGGESSSYPTESLSKGVDALTRALRLMSTRLPLGGSSYFYVVFPTAYCWIVEQLLTALSKMRDSLGSPEREDDETMTVISGQTTYSAQVGVIGTV